MTLHMSVKQILDSQRGTDATLLRLEGGCGVKDRRGDANQATRATRGDMNTKKAERQSGSSGDRSILSCRISLLFMLMSACGR